MILPLATFGLSCAFLIFMGFRDKAKYLAEHPEGDASRSNVEK